MPCGEFVFVILQQAEARAHHLAGRTVAPRLDLGGNEACKVVAEADTGVLGHGAPDIPISGKCRYIRRMGQFRLAGR